MSAEENNYHSTSNFIEDEIDLRLLFNQLWAGKWWIILITGIFAIGSVFYALSIPDEYKAVALVAPASETGNGDLSKMAGQFGGLASIAGVSLGGADTDDTAIAMEVMQTWGFVDAFIKKHNLEVPIFASRGWDRVSNQLVVDSELYDTTQKKWVREAPKGKTIEPTSWELYKVFKELIMVSHDDDSGLIKIGFTHHSPEYAQQITQWLIDDINVLQKTQALADAERNISYLEEQINKTQISDMQKVFYALIEEQMKTKMLAEVSNEFVFKKISPALEPEEPEGPRRSIICIGITLLGGFLSILFLLLKSLIFSNKTNR